ncbi:MAG TPA: hypothetical protein PKZ89_04170 [Alphaproteobacteria bacterium]|nr:hypothetical protein [Alphaproteobacteria bacterium]
MTIDNKLFEDLTRVASGAASVFASLGKHLGEGLKDQMDEKFSGGSSSTAHEDVDRLQGVITKLRVEQEYMKKRIEELEALLGKKPAAKATKKSVVKATATTKAKAPAKKAAVKKRA